TMTSPVFALFLTYLFLGKMAQITGLKSSPTVRQETRFLSVKTGDKLTLQCFYEGDVAARLYWFKQILGQKAKLISTFFKYNVNVTFHNEFKNNPRFTLDMENGKNHLTIKDLRPSDSATYYCINFLYTLDFSESIFVNVDSPFLVYFLSAALAFTTILSVLLAFLMYKVNKRNRCQTAVNHATFPSPSTAIAEGYQDADNLHYAALSVNLPNRSRRQRNNTNDECVYSSVKQ
uniref:Ig-like domain-containing protein n=1 Tax=Sander lucioperca TaxID=283035 RepID=A0A8C9X408_SANLU